GPPGKPGGTGLLSSPGPPGATLSSWSFNSAITQSTSCLRSATPELAYRSRPHCGESSKRPGIQGDTLMAHESPVPAGSEQGRTDASWPGPDSSYAPAAGYRSSGPAGYGHGDPARYGHGDPAGYRH